MTRRLHRAGKKPRIEQVQNRMFDAADILIDRQPLFHPCGSVVGAAAFHGSVNRTKYQEESTNVSIVSVSRSAGAPHAGQATCFQVGCRSSGLPGSSKLISRGNSTGRSDWREPAPRRRPRNGSPGSDSPNSAGAKSPNRAAGTGPRVFLAAGCRASLPRAAGRLLLSPPSWSSHRESAN